MGQEPEAIRRQIEETRAEMGETVEALGYKADVKARAKDNVHEKVDAVQGRLTSVKEKIVGHAETVSDRTPSRDDLRSGTTDRVDGVKHTVGDAAGSARSSVQDGAQTAAHGARQAASVAQENPLGLAIGAAAIGFLGGLLIPATRIEAEKLGPIAHDLREQAEEAGQEAFEHGKAVASDAVQAAKDAAGSAADDVRVAAQDAAQTVKASGQDHVDEVKASVGSSESGSGTPAQPVGSTGLGL